MEYPELKAALNSQVQAVAHYLLPTGKEEAGMMRVGDTNGEQGRSMVVNYEDGLYYDHSSDSGGDMIDLWCDVKHMTPAQAKQDIEQWLGVNEPSFTPPKSLTPAPAYLNPIITQYFNNRGIGIETIKRYKVGAIGTTAIFFRPLKKYKDGKKHNGAKYWPIEGKSGIRQTQGSGNTLFGWQATDGLPKTIVITEGEIDALSVSEADQSHYSALSVPSGATNLKWVLEDAQSLAEHDDIILWMDADEAGQKKVDLIIEGLGKERVRVVSKDSVKAMGCKDANDVLLKFGGDMIVKLLEQAAHVTRMIAACSNMSVELATNLESMTSERISIFPYTAIHPQQITLLAGYNGTGKSTMAMQMAHEGVSQEVGKAFILSPEMPPKVTGGILVRQSTAQVNPTPHEWRNCYDYVRENFVLSVVEERITPESVFRDFDEAYSMGCRMFILDSLTCISLPELEQQADFSDQMRNWIRARPSTYLIVVAHMRKPPAGFHVEPSRYDVRGAGQITDLAGSVFIVDRKNPFNKKSCEVFQDKDAMLKQDKNRATGKLGREWLHFNPISRLMYRDQAPQYAPMTNVRDIK